MNLKDWRKRVELIEHSIQEKRQNLDETIQVRNEFFKQTLGICPGDPATVQSTVEMILRVIEMIEDEEHAK